MQSKRSFPDVDNRAMADFTRGGTITSIANSEELASILNDRMQNRKGGNNRRLAIMLGMFDNNSQIRANIPEKDRSQYSQEKYKFLLETPFEISNKCCNVMKKNPAHTYEKQTGRKPIIATMADESKLRTQKWLQQGCNAFNSNKPTSKPMSFWTEQDVLLYISMNRLSMLYAPWRIMPTKQQVMRYGNRYVYRTTGATASYYPNEYREVCSVYGEVVKDFEAMGQVEGQLSFEDCLTASQLEEFELNKPILKTTGCNRTGCVLCGFGCHLEKEEDARFVRLKETHPGLYGLLDKVENNGVTYREAIEWVNEQGNLNIRL